MTLHALRACEARSTSRVCDSYAKLNRFEKKQTVLQSTLYLRVNVFGTKVLIEDTIFTSATGDGNASRRSSHLQCEVRTFISE